MQLNQAFHYINQMLHHWNLIYGAFNSSLGLFIIYLENALNYYHGSETLCPEGESCKQREE